MTNAPVAWKDAFVGKGAGELLVVSSGTDRR
jgi:hypothetical protein